MILILSQQDNEPATDIVVEWLLKKKANFIRLNGEDLTNNEYSFVTNYSSKINDNAILKIQEKSIDLKQIKVVWYRRWHNFNFLDSLDSNDRNKREARNHCIREINTFSNYLFSLIPKNATWLSSPITSNDNKLTTLFIASQIGLKTPKSIITNNKTDLFNFYIKCNGEIISKPITNSYYYEKGRYLYSHYTEKISEKFIQNLDERFFLSNFQECINKKYDLRIFFLNKEFYSVCVLPLPNTKNIDIKLDHTQETLRRIPYQLPKGLEKKLYSLMQSLNLNTGSIDVIKDINNHYYFIEVNPIGIFSDMSYYCNLQIEEKIADFLIKEDNI